MTIPKDSDIYPIVSINMGSCDADITHVGEREEREGGGFIFRRLRARSDSNFL